MICGDARDLCRLLPKPTRVNLTITSPPYAGTIDYGVDGQIGFGQSFDEYLYDCKAVFEQVASVSTADASMWLITDSVATPSIKARTELLPYRLAEQAEKAGWILRDVVVWHKDRTLPWSGEGRLRDAFEYVFQFVRSQRFQYHIDSLKIGRAHV